MPYLWGSLGYHGWLHNQFSPFFFLLFSTALWDLANSSPAHSLVVSSRLFFCLPCLLPPFTVPCKEKMNTEKLKALAVYCFLSYTRRSNQIRQLRLSQEGVGGGGMGVGFTMLCRIYVFTWNSSMESISTDRLSTRAHNTAGQLS